MASSRVPLLLGAALALLLAASLGLMSGPGLAQTADHLVISEVLYDPLQPGVDVDFEFVEVFNPTGAPVDLTGWALHDNSEQDLVPATVLAPGAYLVIAATSAGFFANYPDFDGDLVVLEDSIGNGLGNAGDRVILVDPGGAPVDAMSYGTDGSEFTPPCPDVPEGQSLARVPASRDSDSAADWVPQSEPNPGGPGIAPTATPTHTPEASPTATETASPTMTHTAEPSPIRTPSPSPTGTATLSPTDTATPKPSPSTSPTATGTVVVTVTATPSGTPTSTASATSTPTASPSATWTPTEEPTHTPTPTLAPALAIRLNEVLPRPFAVDWDGNGTPDAWDEWFGTKGITLRPPTHTARRLPSPHPPPPKSL